MAKRRKQTPMKLGPGAVAASVKFDWFAKKTTKSLQNIIKRRLQTVGKMLRDEIKRRISQSSRTQRSLPGQFPRAETSRLRASIITWYGESDRGVQYQVVATPLVYAKWLEFGTSRKTIFPRQRRALLIPITREEAVEIANRSKYTRRGKRGRALKRGNSLRTRMRRAGIVRKRNKFYLLRKRANRGPLLPRPFFRRTVNEKRGNIRKIMTQPINGLTSKRMIVQQGAVKIASNQ